MQIEDKKEVKVNSKRYINKCDECGSMAIQHEGSCYICYDCGYSPCK